MDHMGPELLDSSSDEDDAYINAAAKLKTLKAEKILVKQDSLPSFPIDVCEAEYNEFPNVVEKNVKEKNEEAISSNQNNTRTIMSEIIEIDDLSNSSIDQTNPSLPSNGPVTRSRSRKNIGSEKQKKVKNISCEPVCTIDLSLESVDTSFCNDDSIEVSDEEQTDNFNTEVKIRWISRDVERIQIGMQENFAKVFKYFASIANVDEDQILITKNGVPISPHDTPSLLKLSIIDVLEGGFVKEHVNVGKIDDDLPKCTIKVQSSLKKFWTFKLQKNEKFKKIFEECAKENNVLMSELKIFFDGELLLPSNTPDDLDIEDEACFDIKISK